MKFETSRFGPIEIDSERILLFPEGVVGYESHRHWVLLSENESDNVGWLQSLSDGSLSFLVVTPHRFVPDYALQIHRNQLLSLPWSPEDETLTLALVSDHDGTLTMNLKAPILVNVHRCLGRQVIVADEQPIRHAIHSPVTPLRKSA